MVKAKKGERKKKIKKSVTVGVVHIKSTFNNTIITITDAEGGVLSWASAGTVGYKGSRKSTPFGAQQAAAEAARRAVDQGVRELSVFVKGPGAGREAALRAIAQSGIHVKLIRDLTPIPHNGCRPRKRRRV